MHDGSYSWDYAKIWQLCQKNNWRWEEKMNSNCDYDHDALCSNYTSGESFISKLNPSKLPTKVYIIIIYEQMK